MTIEAAAAARQWACQQHVVRFFDLLDGKRYEEVAAAFEAQGVWVRPASTLQGREAILASLKARPAQRVTRHLVVNFLVNEDRVGEIDARCTLCTFALENANPSPKLVDALAGIYAATMTFKCLNGAATLARLELAPEISFGR